jgi:transposase
MAAAIGLRADYGVGDLRRLAKASRDARQTRRLLALAVIHDGGWRTGAARVGGVSLQIVRDWVLRLNAEGPAGLIGRKAPGKPPLLSAEHRAALAAAVEAGPKPDPGGVVRWRLVDLVQWLCERFGLSVSRQALGRGLRSMGHAKLSARPRHHAQDPEAIEQLEKAFRTRSRRSAAACPTARGQSCGGSTRRGSGRRTRSPAAGRGTRPRAPHDQRTAWAYPFGAICPEKGKGAGLVMPFCDTKAMQPHLGEISAAANPGAHAVLILDQAGWHLSKDLVVPGNITLLPLPPRSPELNPVENAWQFLRDNRLSNRVLRGYDDIVAHCCDAWNELMDQPWRIRSIGRRSWAHGF